MYRHTEMGAGRACRWEKLLLPLSRERHVIKLRLEFRIERETERETERESE
jgi:hypothetical protein